MKRFFNICKVLTFVALSASLMVSCKKESENVAKAVLGDQTILNFTAQNPVAQKVTVYSDAAWHVTAPEWITVDPTTGSGVMEVTVSVTENVDGGGVMEPRKDKLIISGNTLASQLVISVNQEGDAYRNAEHLTLDKVAALGEGKSFILDEAVVAALTSDGYVLTSGNVQVYTKVSANVAVGDRVALKGVKGAVNGMPAITTVDEVKVTSSGTFTPPTPTNITETVATYAPTSIEYVTVSGVVAGGNLIVTVGDVDYSFKQIDCPGDLSIASLTGELVDLTGYSCGVLGANMFGILTTAFKDNGPAVVPRPEKLLHAKWRFTTSLYPNYAEYFGGTTGVVSQAEGFSDLYVPSNVDGNGKITY